MHESIKTPPMADAGKSDEHYDKTLSQELRDKMSGAFRSLLEWVKPDKDQHVVVQVLVFILKLPLLLLLLVLSPVALVVLVFTFIATL